MEGSTSDYRAIAEESVRERRNPKPARQGTDDLLQRLERMERMLMSACGEGYHPADVARRDASHGAALDRRTRRQVHTPPPEGGKGMLRRIGDAEIYEDERGEKWVRQKSVQRRDHSSPRAGRKRARVGFQETDTRSEEG